MIKIFDIQSSDVVSAHPLAKVNHWETLHTVRNPTPSWFANWESKIPCGACKENYKKLRIEPRYDDWFRFTVELHNAVNAKLEKPRVEIDEAYRLWKPMPQPQSKVHGLKIVTSFSLKRIERQKHCLQTWLNCGFDIVAIQHKDEMKEVQSAFSTKGLSFKLGRATTAYDYQTVRIDDVLRAVKNTPFLVINSDLAIVDREPILKDLRDRKRTLYLRWNYETAYIDLATEFEWGIDSFLLWPCDVAHFPESPFGLGQPAWDYAIPHWIRLIGLKYHINHSVIMMHENHKQNWHQRSWELGNEWIISLWPKVYIGDPAFRRSLDPEYIYSREYRKWIT
jgi:hypothetical protein